METTKIKFTRARSSTGESLSTMLTNRNYDVEYGEPLLYKKSSHYDQYTTKSISNDLFIGIDNGTSNPQIDLMHIGPYYGGNGISVQNDVDASNLGEISCNITSGAGINVAVQNGAYVISNTASGDSTWSKTVLTEGTTSYTITPAQRTERYIIDNSGNTSPVTVTVGNRSTDTYYEATDNDLYTVSAGTVKMYTVRELSTGVYVVDAKAMSLYRTSGGQNI